MQNRKSARKCRIKKKEEFSTLKEEVVELRKDNASLKDKVSLQAPTHSLQINEMSILLFQKIEENTGLQRKLD